MRRRIVDGGQQVLGRCPADILKAHVDAGQRWLRAEHHGLPVVEADQRDVASYPAPEQAPDPVWFGGGKLAADLTLPRLRTRWEPARTSQGGQFTAQERNAIWEHAASTAAEASAHIRSAAATSPADAADAAWAAADTLRVAASALRSRELHRAAAAYDRAARCPYGRVPRATPAGNGCARQPVCSPPYRLPAIGASPSSRSSHASPP